MKTSLLLLTILFVFEANAQLDTVVTYLDSNYSSTVISKASMLQKVYKKDGLYICNRFYYPSMKLKHESINKDSFLSKKIGTYSEYYESGKIKSTYNTEKKIFNSFYESGNKEVESFQNEAKKTTNLNHYFETGKLMATATYDKNDNETNSKGFNEDGSEIPNYIYQREAVFVGGRQGWMDFLMNNLDADVPTKKRAPFGKYSVVLSFLIDKEGNVTDIKAENDPGYGTKAEAIRIMKKSPKWVPAIQYNKLVKYRARQPITFVVSPEY